jgi:decaprenylphospho-beta-D-ribofuranose 2-oxidase
MANSRQFWHTGWGRNIWSFSKLISAGDDSLVAEARPRGVIAVGKGRSYGDSALNSNGVRIDTSCWKHVERLGESSVFRCGSGLTIGELSRFSIPLGFYPYVVPGTEHVTIGGAIAGDIHGKSHHRVGSFSNKVLRIKIMLSSGKFAEVFPNGETENLFNATAAGLGLTGLICEADIELMPINCHLIELKEKRARSLREMMDILISEDANYFYSVAWIELSGSYRGRGRVLLGNHCKEPHLIKNKSTENEWMKPPRFIEIPSIFRFNFMIPVFVRIFNVLWFWKPLARSRTTIRKFMHPLDGIANWNLLYGRKGFVQYQFVIPNEHSDFLFKVLENLRRYKIASPLGVLKKLGKESSALLGFAKPGWTLAIDIPVGITGVAQLLDEFDRELISLGGRVYLVKDSRVSAESLSEMYPNLDAWRSVKNKYDPENLWQSDQSRRLNL